MKKTIRIGMFETNSSSTHTCILCSKNNFERWEKGEMFYYNRLFWITPEKDPLRKTDSEVHLANLNTDFDKDFFEPEELIAFGLPMNEFLKKVETDEEYANEILEDYYDDVYSFLFEEFSLLHKDYEIEYEIDRAEKNIDGVDVVAFCWYGNDW